MANIWLQAFGRSKELNRSWIWAGLIIAVFGFIPVVINLPFMLTKEQVISLLLAYALPWIFIGLCAAMLNL